MLARKWRPQTFADLVGQEHVVKALVNALQTDRLHHAYLFTGIRGVGKTTIARIFAKSLNCETGVTAEPCGECSVCKDISAGRFLDLIEVDAASSNGVDNTRELLENSHYAPTSGRYKVYLIDEVHMFSNSSFNALLKTLEEPPEHVKFILATTETKKLPATILSRCLQFNLKAMPGSLLAGHLEHILSKENIAFEPAALQYVARVAEGSVRDSLSLVEQMVSMGEGTVSSAVVEEMLGIMSPQRVTALATTIVQGDAAKALEQVAAMDEFAPDYRQLLADFLSIFHQVAIMQMVPGSRDTHSRWDGDALDELGRMLTPEQIQLYYDICLKGQRDLALAPYARDSFEMTLLRLIFFKQAVGGAEQPDPSATKDSTNASTSSSAGAVADTPVAMNGHASTESASELIDRTSINSTSTDSSLIDSSKAAPVNSAEVGDQSPLPRPTEANAAVDSSDNTPVGIILSEQNWLDVVESLPLRGVAAELAANVGYVALNEHNISLSIAERHEDLNRPAEHKRLQQALSEIVAKPLKLEIVTTAHTNETLAEKRVRLQCEAIKSAEASIAADPLVQTLLDRVEGQVEKDSIQPLGSTH